MTQTRRIAFGAFLFLLLEAALIAFVDRPLSQGLRIVDTNHPALIDFFRAWTDLGKSKWYLWPAALGILSCAVLVRLKSLTQTLRECFGRTGNLFLFLFICVAVSGIVTDIIKPILGRARPVELEQNGFYGFHPLSFDARWNSLPSGHATTAFAMAFVLTGMYPRARMVFFFFAICLAASRVMVNAHFLSDTLAGVAVAFLTIRAVQRPEGESGIFHINRRFFPIDDETGRG